MKCVAAVLVALVALLAVEQAAGLDWSTAAVTPGFEATLTDKGMNYVREVSLIA